MRQAFSNFTAVKQMTLTVPQSTVAFARGRFSYIFFLCVAHTSPISPTLFPLLPSNAKPKRPLVAVTGDGIQILRKMFYARRAFSPWRAREVQDQYSARHSLFRGR